MYIIYIYNYPQAPCVAQAQNSVNYKDFLFTLTSHINSPTPVKLLHSLKIFNKGLILPPPLNSSIH